MTAVAVETAAKVPEAGFEELEAAAIAAASGKSTPAAVATAVAAAETVPATAAAIVTAAVAAMKDIERIEFRKPRVIRALGVIPQVRSVVVDDLAGVLRLVEDNSPPAWRARGWVSSGLEPRSRATCGKTSFSHVASGGRGLPLSNIIPAISSGRVTFGKINHVQATNGKINHVQATNAIGSRNG